MKDHVRRAMAYVVLRLTSDNGTALVQDHAISKMFRFEAEVAPTRTKISVFDPDQNCKIDGVGGGGLYTLTHGGTGKKVSLKLRGNNFDGFDFDTTKPYSGVVNGKSVTIQDAEHGKDFQYSG